MGVYMYHDSPPPDFRASDGVVMKGYNPSTVKDRVFRLLVKEGGFERKRAAAFATLAMEEAIRVYRVFNNYRLLGLGFIEFRIVISPADDGYVRERLEGIFPAYPIKIIYNKEVVYGTEV